MMMSEKDQVNLANSDLGKPFYDIPRAEPDQQSTISRLEGVDIAGVIKSIEVFAQLSQGAGGKEIAFVPEREIDREGLQLDNRRLFGWRGSNGGKTGGDHDPDSQGKENTSPMLH